MNTRRELKLSDGSSIDFFSIPALEREGFGDASRTPASLRVLLEGLLRAQARGQCPPESVAHLATWTPGRAEREEIPFMPSRVLLQDFTGVPCLVDLAALRSALRRRGADPSSVEPLVPVDLVIDHSVQLDASASRAAFDINLDREYERNRERYAFLRWGRRTFRNLTVMPPGLGICHQVNMERLATCVRIATSGGRPFAGPDTLVGTDSHTPMVNSMGVLGWGVGGIEAEAAMLGHPIPVLTPSVTGVRLAGELPDGATPTDLALAVTAALRKQGVVGHFVEFFGPGLDTMSLADRAPIANMAPEYGATIGFFPVDDATLAYLRATGRAPAHVDLVERYTKEQGLFRTRGAPEPRCDAVVEIDLARVEPSVAGPRRPHERIPVKRLHQAFAESLRQPIEDGGFGVVDGLSTDSAHRLTHGAVVIAAITSCTNTSNPTLMLAAGLLARKAAALGLRPPAWVKTSFAPGSRVVTDYLERAGLLKDLESLGFHVAAYGCTTCIGNSGPLPEDTAAAIRERQLVAVAVLSGNRNFDGRIHPLTQANYLCSPPLVVAYALKGTVLGSLTDAPLGMDPAGRPVFLRDLWPSKAEVRALLDLTDDAALYKRRYNAPQPSDARWDALPSGASDDDTWDDASTYIREPPWVRNIGAEPEPVQDLRGARILCLLGDFVTTDHISPAGDIPADGTAGRYLRERGVPPAEFNSFGARRGNHEVMVRGTFANIRLRNQLVRRAGGWTRHLPSGDEMEIFDAAQRYRSEGVPLVVVAGKMYGAGSSRDWAAKGAALLGVRAVIAHSFERIHRGNLLGMGVLPLEFAEGAAPPALNGGETISIFGIKRNMSPGAMFDAEAVRPDGTTLRFAARARIDTPQELDVYLHGGILPLVLRGLLGGR